MRPGLSYVVAALGIWLTVRAAHAKSCNLSAECIVEGSASSCAGDCDNDGSVTIDEIIKGVNIALEKALIGDCSAFDVDASSAITVDELIKGVNAALVGCPAPPPASTATTEPSAATTPTASINPRSPTPTLSASASPGVSPPPSTPSVTATITVGPSPTPSTHVTLALQVGPAGALVFAGSSRWLRVDLTRGAGFTGDVDVTISDPPAGVSGDFVTLPSDVATQGLAISVAPGTPLGELALTLVASGGGANASAQVVVNVLAAAPSSQEKIAAALAAAEIDLATSLLYRCYARAGDALLPEAFRGSGSEEDLGLPQAIDAASSELSAQQLAALRPYTVRPDHPESVYAWAPGRRAQRARAPAPEDCAGGNQWRSKRSASFPVRVWIECDAVGGESTLNRVLANFEKFWVPMIVLMGPPLRDLGGDDGGGDDAIDVYLVLGAISRGGQLHDPYSLAALGAIAYAPMAPPFRENANGRRISSGFIVTPRIGATSQSERASHTHEFFHILQFAHNIQYMVKGENFHWFVDASATWAEVHFDRTIPWPARIAGEVHGSRFPAFQSEAIALNASPPSWHTYASYIWPFFLEQLYATDDIIGDIWSGLDRVANWDEADDVMEFHSNFTGNFHTFAIRNLNAEFLPGDPLPASERYAALDKLFPDKLYPPKTESVHLRSGTVYTKALDMPPLSAAYFEINPLRSSPIRKVELDLTGLLPQGNLDVDALVWTYTDDDPLGSIWLPKPLSLSGEGRVLFCFDEGPTTATRRGAFDQLVLVLSNHALREPIEGEIRITPSKAPCGVWAGTTTQTVSYDDGFQRTTGTITTNVVFEFDEAAADGGAPRQTPFRLQGGDFVYKWNFDQYAQKCRGVATAGGAMHRAASVLDFKAGATLAHLTVYSGNPPMYGGGGLSYAEVTTVTDCNDDRHDRTSTNISPVTWWPGGGFLPVQPDGKTIRDSYDALPGIHTEWTFSKLRQ